MNPPGPEPLTFEQSELRRAELAGEVARLEAACAAMRHLLIILKPQVAIWLAGSGELKAIEDALSTTAGADFLKQHRDLENQLAEFHAAMEREKAPKWNDDLKELAAFIEAVFMPEPADHYKLQQAARQLRYMADCFTLKANFVPSELRIKELEAKRDKFEAALRRIESYPVHSEPVGGALAMQDIAHAALNTIKTP